MIDFFVKVKYYGEASRFMDNAKEYLKNAQKEGHFYLDKKYVKTACRTAYNGLLVALDGFLQIIWIALMKSFIFWDITME